MTKQEFKDKYSMVVNFEREDHGALVVLPCFCLDPICEGWVVFLKQQTTLINYHMRMYGFLAN